MGRPKTEADHDWEAEHGIEDDRCDHTYSRFSSSCVKCGEEMEEEAIPEVHC